MPQSSSGLGFIPFTDNTGIQIPLGVSRLNLEQSQTLPYNPNLTMAITKIDPSLEGKNRARLESRTYDKNYTPIPNSSLPVTLLDQLSTVWFGLTGEELPADESSFLIRAVDGQLKSIYGPSVYSPEGWGTSERLEQTGPVIKWGSRMIPLALADGKIGLASVPSYLTADGSAPTKSATPRIKFLFRSEKLGKYDETCLVVTVTKGSDSVVLPLPVKSKDYKNPVHADQLELWLEDGNVTDLLDALLPASVAGSGGTDNQPRLFGPIVKIANLPLGDYPITAYRSYDSQYGKKYLLQSTVASGDDDGFDAVVRQQIGDDWVDSQVTLEPGTDFIIKPNSKISSILGADPVITPELPAVLSVTKYGSYNGHTTVNANLRVGLGAFLPDDDSFDVSF